MLNRDIYERVPGTIALLNRGVAKMSDALTEAERRTLRFELEHFVCEGEYRRGLVRILESYTSNQGQPEQPAAWISGFFGSGKSHLAKVLRFLWTDYIFPEDEASARGLARLPDDVRDLLTEITTLGRRHGGLCAAAGTLGSGAGDSVRLALLGILFKSVDLPESYPLARFCLWLKKYGIYDSVCAAVEAEGRSFRSELDDLYVSSAIANALLDTDPSFAGNVLETRQALRAQFPRQSEISSDEFVRVFRETLAPSGEMPVTVIVLDEVQQYIGSDTVKSYAVQELVEACSRQLGERLLFVGTGQTALSGTPALQRLQGRFTVNVELSDTDVETVTRRVVLAKRPDRADRIVAVLEHSAGELDRHLIGSKIGARHEDKSVLVEDYPLLPVRRRFWEHVLRAVDKAGTTGQLRTQLRIVYEAIRSTAEDPLGTVVPADFLFEQISQSLLQSGVLLREVNDIIARQDDDSAEGRLKYRLCALIFLIRNLPREAGADIGVRATCDVLADLLVRDLANDGAVLRGKLPRVLEALVADGTLIKLDNEYSLQTRESSEWEAEYRRRRAILANDFTRMSSMRSQLLKNKMGESIRSVRLIHGASREPRRLRLYFGMEPPPDDANEILIWVRDGWGADERSVVADARADGADSPVIHVFVSKVRAEALANAIAESGAAQETLEYKGVTTAPEGIEARTGMETRLHEAKSSQQALIAEVVSGARVYQGGGNEKLESSLADRIKAAASASLDRLFPEFRDGDHDHWRRVIQRARRGTENPLEALNFSGKTEDHPVCSAVLSFTGSGMKGKRIRDHFSTPPYGWPRDAIDGAIMTLFGSGHLRATYNGVPLKAGTLDQSKLSVADFRVESVTIDTRQRIRLRRLFTDAGIPWKPNEESAAADEFLSKLSSLAGRAGGDAPLPASPDTRLITELRSLIGNEQLIAILKNHDVLKQDFADWSSATDLAEKRWPTYQCLESLAGHADQLGVIEEVRPQIKAIVSSRSLLEPTDPIPSLAKKLTDALRTALARAEKQHGAVFEQEMKALEATASWQEIEEADRNTILKELTITKASKGSTGTEQDVLDSLERVSLQSWKMRTAALPPLFEKARIRAAKLVEPETQQVRLPRATLRSQADINDWVEKTEQELLEHLERGPIMIM